MTVTVDMSGALNKFRNLKRLKLEVMKPAADYFEMITPIRTGNAKNNTYLQGDKIEANYTYAFVLDAGRGFRDGQMRGSIQAPMGMSAPTTTYLQQLITRYVKKYGAKG